MGTRKQQAHDLAQRWWHTALAERARVRGYAVCDARSGHRIAPDGGYLCNPQRMGDQTPDMVCEECFDRLPYDPWDGGYSGLKPGPHKTPEAAIQALLAKAQAAPSPNGPQSPSDNSLPPLNTPAEVFKALDAMAPRWINDAAKDRRLTALAVEVDARARVDSDFLISLLVRLAPMVESGAPEDRVKAWVLLVPLADHDPVSQHLLDELQKNISQIERFEWSWKLIGCLSVLAALVLFIVILAAVAVGRWMSG